MSYSEQERQAADAVPPRKSNVAALGVDATARAYDVTALAFNGATYNEHAQDRVYLALQAEGADPVYFYFHSATDTALDDTAKTAAGGTLAFAATHAGIIAANTTVYVRIRRELDKFLVVKCAATKTATLRIYAVSEPSPRAQ